MASFLDSFHANGLKKAREVVYPLSRGYAGTKRGSSKAPDREFNGELGTRAIYVKK